MNSYVIRQEISSQLPVPSFQLQTARELLRKGGQLYLTGRETDNVSASKTCGHEGLRSSLYPRVRKCKLATLLRDPAPSAFSAEIFTVSLITVPSNFSIVAFKNYTEDGAGCGLES